MSTQLSDSHRNCKSWALSPFDYKFWYRGPEELGNGPFFGYQQLYTLQTFYLTSSLSSGNRLIKTKLLFLLTRKNSASKDAASFPTKCSTKRKINFDRFQSPSFVNFNSVLASQKSDRPHSASLRWHTEDFFALSGRLYIVLQRPLHHTKRKGDGLIFIWSTEKVSKTPYKIRNDSFYLGERHYVTPYDIASRKSIILQQRFVRFVASLKFLLDIIF